MAMTLRLTEDEDNTLQRLADAQHLSKHEAAVQAIKAQADRITAAAGVRDWADHALVRYESLLRRLAQ